MNRMRTDKINSIPALWYLATAYHLAGQPEVAKEMTSQAAIDVKDYKELSNTFGSDERDKAIILQALVTMGDKTKATPLMMDLSKTLNSNDDMNTQSIAYSLVAISRYTGKYNLSADMKFAYQLKEGKWKETSSKRPIWEESVKNDKEETAEIKNTGNGLIFAKVITQGVPEEGDKTDSSSHLKLEITYKTMSGKVINPASITQGTDFMAEVTVIHTGDRGDYEQMSLTQIFPSGWEIHNSRMSGDDMTKSSSFDYQDIRDDRVNIFYSLKKAEKKTFVVLLNASYKGKFYLPTIYAEAMYDNSISARKHGSWVEVE